MHTPELNEKNVSIVIQSAMERLSAIDSRIALKEGELKNLDGNIEKAKAEVVTLNQEITGLTTKRDNAKIELSNIQSETEVTREKIRVEFQKAIAKLEDLFLKISDAKEVYLKTITETASAKEKEVFALIDKAQEKKREIQALEKEAGVVNNELENAKKQAFTLQTKFDDLREKEQFIKRKYEDAGIPYTQ